MIIEAKTEDSTATRMSDEKIAEITTVEGIPIDEWRKRRREELDKDRKLIPSRDNKSVTV
jgi:hypothetical protein